MSNLSCDICCLTFSNLSNLKRHCKNRHNAIVQRDDRSDNWITERFTFYSDEEFTEWKEKLELDTCSSFIRRSGIKRRGENTTVQYFQCHRSGVYTPLQQNRKRNLKTSGTIKIGGHCPAKIVLCRTTIDCAVEIAVKYVSTHIGHRAEPKGTSSATSAPRRRPDKANETNMSLSIDACHALSTQIPSEGILETRLGLSWIMPSSVDTADAETCEVVRVQSCCESFPRCDAWCQWCQACLHRYQCSCLEQSVRLQVCKHIHKACQLDSTPLAENQQKTEIAACGDGKDCGSNYHELQMATEAIEVTNQEEKVEDGLARAVDEALRDELGTCLLKIPDEGLDARKANVIGKLHAAIEKTRSVSTHEHMDVLDSLVSTMIDNLDDWQLQFYPEAGIRIPMFMCASTDQ